MNPRRLDSNEIIKIFDYLIGSVEPVGDSAIDDIIEQNLKILIDVVNWCFDCIYFSAKNRKSVYYSESRVGERAYAALLDWKQWISEIEQELA